MGGNQQVRYSPLGEEIIFRPPGAELWSRTIIQAIWVIGVVALFIWSAPSIIAYFQRGEIIGPARLLERFHLSPNMFLAAMIAWCFFLAWWGLGGIYEIVKVQLRKDRFLLRSDSLNVRRRKFITREFTFPSYEQVAFRLAHSDGSLEAKTKNGITTLTDCGTYEDRKWLLELLEQRYKSLADLPAVNEPSRENVGTYLVERRADGTLHITSSGVSTFGCAMIAAVLCVGLVSFAVWLFVRNSGGGIIPLMFAFAIGIAGLSALNRRTVIASKGRLRVQWHSPVGNFLQRFVPKNNTAFKTQFGGGNYERDTGTLRMKVSHAGQKSSPHHSVYLLQELSEEELEEDEEEQQEEYQKEEHLEEIEDEEEEEWKYTEELVLDVHGHASEHAAEHLLRILAQTTGFPVYKS